MNDLKDVFVQKAPENKRRVFSSLTSSRQSKTISMKEKLKKNQTND